MVAPHENTDRDLSDPIHSIVRFSERAAGNSYLADPKKAGDDAANAAKDGVK